MRSARLDDLPDCSAEAGRNIYARWLFLGANSVNRRTRRRAMGEGRVRRGTLPCMGLSEAMHYGEYLSNRVARCLIATAP
jgi:hypothetical protein